MMEVRSKKCRLCGHRSGLANPTCGNCDSDDMYVVMEVITDIDDSFWIVTLSRAVYDLKEAIGFQESVLDAMERWRSFTSGHGFKPDSLIMESGVEMGEIEMFWDFPYDKGGDAVELIYELSRHRPGVTDEAQITIDYYDTVDVKGE